METIFSLFDLAYSPVHNKQCKCLSVQCHLIRLRFLWKEADCTVLSINELSCISIIIRERVEEAMQDHLGRM